MRLKLTTARALQPVTLAEAKAHLNVDHSDDDSWITDAIVAATDDCEGTLRRSVLPQTWTLYLDAFPVNPAGAPGMAYEVVLPRPSVLSVASIKYLRATDGVLTTLSGGAYVLANGSDYDARVVPAYATVWPDTQQMPDAVQIAFVSGWPDVASVPMSVKMWIKARVAALYENREQAGVFIGGAPLAVGFLDALLDPHRADTLY